MGWTSAAVPASQLIDEAFGKDNIIDRAWGGSHYGTRTCWVLYNAYGDPEQPALAVALVQSYTQHGDRHNAVKIVGEEMGPSYHDVPDRIWNKRPDTPPNGYATEWRRQVEQHRETWPTRVTDLTADDVGATVRVEGYGDRDFVFSGWKRHKRGTVPTFNHRRIQGWNTARCNIVN